MVRSHELQAAQAAVERDGGTHAHIIHDLRVLGARHGDLALLWGTAAGQSHGIRVARDRRRARGGLPRPVFTPDSPALHRRAAGFNTLNAGEALTRPSTEW
ncbi:hypothetical protein GCM10009838_76880 [Catenulispora subtropica]|uniref:Uncharacterized protein n=1 Tax=Catenulispora subtropica TaxID=450798 RepID=A0ABP5ELA0_9ACTN